MDKITYTLSNLEKMIIALERSVIALENLKTEDLQNREYFEDSVVARFRFLIEATWKDVAHVLKNRGFAEVPAAPKPLVSFAQEAGFLSKPEADLFVECIKLCHAASPVYDQSQYLLAVTKAPTAISLAKELVVRMRQWEKKVK